MSLPTLNGRFPTFSSFWSHFKERLANDYRPKGRVNNIFMSKNLFEYFKNWPFWEDEEDGVNSFMTILAFICSEVEQKDIIHDKIYSQIDDFMTVTTESRRVVRTSESKGRKTWNYDEPLLTIPNMKQGIIGYHERANWLKKTIHSDQAPEIQISEGILTTDKDGKKTVKPNWTKVDDPAAVARLVNSFNNVEIEYKQFIPRFKGIFLNIVAPSTDYIYDEETKTQRWKGRAQIIEEEQEEAGETIKPKTIDDDITEKEYNQLKTENANQVAENWQVERFTRRKKYLESQIKKMGGALKEKLMLKLEGIESLLEAFQKIVKMPPIGEQNEKLPATANQEEWDKASFWARINRTIGYVELKNSFADFADGYNDLLADEIDIPPRMFLLLGPPGVGKTHIAEMIAESIGLPIETISMNGKKDTSVFFGVPQEYAGATMGEVLKAITRTKNKSMVIVFDEIDKCDKQVQQVLGNITDKKLNKKFKDVFLDYSVPINQLIIFVTANYPEDIEQFLFSRLTPVKVAPNTFKERLEIANDFLDYQFKKYKISSLRSRVSQLLLKKMLTWEWGVRGLMANIEDFSYKVWIDNKRGRLSDDWDNYKSWPIMQKLELDSGDVRRNRPACPVYADHKVAHRSGCECFKPEEIKGWVTEMGNEYPKI